MTNICVKMLALTLTLSHSYLYTCSHAGIFTLAHSHTGTLSRTVTLIGLVSLVVQNIRMSAHSAQPSIKPSVDELNGKYELTAYIGRGSYGVVWSAINIAAANANSNHNENNDSNKKKKTQKTKKLVAIKKLSQVTCTVQKTLSLLREIKFGRLLQHENIVAFHQVLPPSTANFRDVSIVSELMETTLLNAINTDITTIESHTQFFLYQLLCGLQYMHSLGVLHRDIKSSNLLINTDCTLRICDFGSARFTEVAFEYLQRRQFNASDSDSDDSTSDDHSEHAIINNNNNVSSQVAPINLSSARNTATSLCQEQLQLQTYELTQHVTTRWYRAPEIILLSDYGFPADMWSVGCVFAELMQMQECTGVVRGARQPLFCGASCFPLTADNSTDCHNDTDQLNVIFKLIGTPDERSIDAVTNADSRQYLRYVKKSKADNIRKLYKGISPQAYDLLSRMLTFNPQDRITVSDALQHPFLATMCQDHTNHVIPLNSIKDGSREAKMLQTSEWEFETYKPATIAHHAQHLLLPEICRDNPAFVMHVSKEQTTTNEFAPCYESQHNQQAHTNTNILIATA